MVESSLWTGFFYQSYSAAEKLETVADQYTAIESVTVHTLSPNNLILVTDHQNIDVVTDEEVINVFEHEKGTLFVCLSCDRLAREDNVDRLQEYIGIVRDVYRLTDPAAVCGMHDWRLENIGEYIPSPVTDESVANSRIDFPTWLMIFPPAMVETYGREWLLDLPAARIEELDDGAIMTVATEEITECETDTEIAETIFETMKPLEEAFGVEPRTS